MGMFWGTFTQNLIRYESGNITAASETALLSRSVVYSGHGISFDYNSKTPLLFPNNTHGQMTTPETNQMGLLPVNSTPRRPVPVARHDERTHYGAEQRRKPA